MEFKDYYAAMGLTRTATPEEIKRSYRRLARKFHPDVSREPDAEERFKAIKEAYEALKDPDKRAAYDDVSRRFHQGESFDPPPGWDSGFEFRGRGDGDARHAMNGEFDSDQMSEFFASLFGRAPRQSRGHRESPGGSHGARPSGATDRHAKITIDLEDAYHGAQRTISLQVPVVGAQGEVSLVERKLDIHIPKGIRAGQHLRLAGQGDAAVEGQSAGDLYLEIVLRPHQIYRVDGFDVHLDLPVAPWEAALGATVMAPTPDGEVELTIPPGSSAGRKLRLKGRGLPGATAGDLYVRLEILLPPVDGSAAKEAYSAMHQSFPTFNPRHSVQA